MMGERAARQDPDETLKEIDQALEDNKGLIEVITHLGAGATTEQRLDEEATKTLNMFSEQSDNRR